MLQISATKVKSVLDIRCSWVTVVDTHLILFSGPRQVGDPAGLRVDAGRRREYDEQAAAEESSQGTVGKSTVGVSIGGITVGTDGQVW